MSKLNHLLAWVRDDDGQMHDINVYYSDTENKFQAIEDEAVSRGIRYENTVQFQLQTEVNDNE